MNASWRLSPKGNIQVLEVGDLLSEPTMKDILKRIDLQMRSGHYNYVVDMSAVNYINSIGLNLLIVLKERTRKVGGRLILANCSPTVLRLLEMTKLQALFEITDSVEGALGAFTPENN